MWKKEIPIEQEDYLRNLPSLPVLSPPPVADRLKLNLNSLSLDITEMLIRVNNALSQVQSYPENVDEPQIYANSFSSNAFIFYSITPLPGNPRQIGWI